MDKNSIREKLINAFDSLNKIVKIAGLEVVNIENSELKSLVKKAFNEEISLISIEKINEEKDLINNEDKSVISLKVQSEDNNEIYITIYPFVTDSKPSGYIIFQNNKPLEPNNEKLLSFYSEVISIFESDINEEPSAEGRDSKYKQELMNLRNIQAQLFPKFTNIPGLDISSVYLPADLMGGNFVDAFFLDNKRYQIIVCDIMGYDATSSFIGAAIRTLIRADSSKKMVPSALIELINSKFTKMIAGSHALIFLSVYQINTKNGHTKMSSLGDINTIYFNSKKKGSANLNNTELGKTLSKRNFIRDMSIILEPGDSLLYFSNGVKNAASEDGKTVYGIESLKKIFLENMDSPSLDIVHSMTESIYEFTNYSPITEDIILLPIKKT